MVWASALYHGSESQGFWVWNWEPSVLIGLTLLTAAYLAAVGPLRRRLRYGPPVPPGRIIAFLLANLILFIALVSPLDHLSDEVLFSAHMAQHILLLGFVPVLWLVGLPEGLLNALVQSSALRQVMRQFTSPIQAFIIMNLVMLTWHVPALYDAALGNETVHLFEHLSFMAAAVIGWWPIFGRFEEAAPRPDLGVQLIYLFLMMFPSTALAAWITLSRTIVYPFYGNAPIQLGLTPEADQQLAGLLMWIPGNALSFMIFTLVFFRWFQHASSQENDNDLDVLSETANSPRE
jgi:putative membrane protein